MKDPNYIQGTPYQRITDAGQRPCPECVWVKGRIKEYCDKHTIEAIKRGMRE